LQTVVVGWWVVVGMVGRSRKTVEIECDAADGDDNDGWWKYGPLQQMSNSMYRRDSVEGVEQ